MDVITFGCRLNQVESRRIAEILKIEGMPETVVVNSCAVTAEAERQVRQALRKVRRERPESRIVLTGCAGSIDPEGYASLVDLIVPNAAKLDPGQYQSAPGSEASEGRVADEAEALWSMPDSEGLCRAFVQIQNGCDHSCTFCTIPQGRGSSRSADPGQVSGYIGQLQQQGVQEVTLTGVDLTSYHSQNHNLGRLVRRILRDHPSLTRLRLSSLDCGEIDPLLLRLIADEERLMPYMHLSLQSGDDLILKRMKRRHSRSMAIETCAQLCQLRPDMRLGADLIVGFPTEDEAMFQSSVSLLETCGLSQVHVFPYSARPGTPGARIPRQVPGAERRARALRLRQAAEARARAHARGCVGRGVEVLAERADFGYSQDYTPVRLSRPVAPGTMVRGEVAGVEAQRLVL